MTARVDTTYSGLGMVQTRDDSRIEDGDTRSNSLGRVVEQSLEVRIGRQTEAGNTRMGTVDDEEGPIRKRCRRKRC